MIADAVQQLHDVGQSIWLDNIRRDYLTGGELQRLIDLGVTGLTSNPSIFEKAITSSNDYDKSLLKYSKQGKDANAIFESLAIEDISDAADLLRPVYDLTDGADGYASIEVNPHLAHDTQGTIEEARRLFSTLGKPNVLIKVPGTPEGVPAIQQLIGEGINVNVTLLFSLDAYADVREAYISGLEAFDKAGGDLSKVASVASFFVSRVDTSVDGQLDAHIGNGRSDLESLLGKAAIANAKLAYRDFQQTFGTERFAALKAKGARYQRPLWASTSVKNPAYSDVLYIETLIGPNTVNTLPDATLEAFLDHGKVAQTIDQGVSDAEKTLQTVEQANISMKAVTDKLLVDGVKAFADSFDQLIINVEYKRKQLQLANA